MENKIMFNYSRNAKPKEPDVLLKSVALLFLTEALYKEEYENCPELIQKAKGFGARKREITRVLEKSRSRFVGGLLSEANAKKNRPRF